MGACCSWCKEDDTYTSGVEHERTHLLVNPACNNTSIQQGVSDDCNYGSLPKETIEKHDYSHISATMQSGVIHNLSQNCIDQQEVVERQNIYFSKLQSIPLSSVTNTVFSLRQDPACLLKDVPGHEILLTRNIGLPENYRDILLHVSEIQKLLAAMNVEHKGELIAQF